MSTNASPALYAHPWCPLTVEPPAHQPIWLSMADGSVIEATSLTQHDTAENQAIAWTPIPAPPPALTSIYRSDYDTDGPAPRLVRAAIRIATGDYEKATGELSILSEPAALLFLQDLTVLAEGRLPASAVLARHLKHAASQARIKTHSAYENGNQDAYYDLSALESVILAGGLDRDAPPPRTFRKRT